MRVYELTSETKNRHKLFKPDFKLCKPKKECKPKPKQKIHHLLFGWLEELEDNETVSTFRRESLLK